MPISFFNKHNFSIQTIDIQYLETIFKYILLEFKLPESEVELEIVDSNKMRKINKKHRKIDKSTDVLSFSFFETIKTRHIGIIYICYEEISLFSNNSFIYNFSFLFIHGVLHILGLDHGDAMTSLENKVVGKFFKK